MPDWLITAGSSIGFIVAFWITFSLLSRKKPAGHRGGNHSPEQSGD
jgi:hypothetical protein